MLCCALFCQRKLLQNLTKEKAGYKPLRAGMHSIPEDAGARPFFFENPPKTAKKKGQVFQVFLFLVFFNYIAILKIKKDNRF
jgi:hypothetical protein